MGSNIVNVSAFLARYKIPNVVLIANLSLFIIDADRKLQGMI
jgi:hypothetical protein